ncbi:MAG: hypothetical protein PHV34_05570 [Verrucomicrobiae bacterium]|nr:hypothetical protein [Verrucomicrobiae bacterium]
MKISLASMICPGAVLFFATLIQGQEVVDKSIAGEWKFQEGEGTVVKDCSPNGNHGVILGGQWGKGGFGFALRLENDKDGIRIENSPSLEPDMLAVECWFCPDKDIDKKLSRHEYLISKLLPGKGYALGFREKMGSLAFHFGKGVYAKTAAWKKGEWHHVVGTYDGKVSRIYVDGRMENERECGTRVKSPNCMMVGNFFNGWIGRLVIRSRVLTGDEISRIYSEEKGRIATQVEVIGKRVAGTAKVSAAAPPKQAKKGTEKIIHNIFRPRLGDTEFIVPSKTGFLRNYRRIDTDPIIDLISLAEGDRAQVKLGEMRWKYQWEGGEMKLSQGDVLSDDKAAADPGWDSPSHLKGMSQVLVGPKDSRVELTAQGKLYNSWTQKIIWQDEKNGDGNSHGLTLHWKRDVKEIMEPAAIVRFTRRADDQEMEVFLKGMDGKTNQLKNNEKLGMEKGAALYAVDFFNGTQIEIQFDLPGKIERVPCKASENLIGGWSLVFVPNDGEMLEEFSMKILDTPLPRFESQGLMVKSHLQTGCHVVSAGNMPLFQIGGWESNLRQENAGFLGGFWKSKVFKKDALFQIASEGKLQSDWKSICRSTQKGLNFELKTGQGVEKAAMALRIPYEWVGTPLVLYKNEVKEDVKGVVPPYLDGAMVTATQVAEINGIPLRIGVDLDFGAMPENSLIEWRPTASERIIFTLKRNCRMISSRAKLSAYQEPFDATSEPDFVKKVGQGHAIDKAPPAFLLFYPSDGKECAFDVSYRQILRQTPMDVSSKNAPVPDKPLMCVRDGARVVVKTPWWEVIHDKEKGGTPVSIQFPQGLKRNILKSPVEGYLADKAGNSLRESASKITSFEVKEEAPDQIRMIVKGLFGGGTLPFEAEYLYSEGGFRRSVRFDFQKAPMDIKVLGVTRIETDHALDFAKYKPCLMKYARAVFPGPCIVKGNRLSLGVMGLYRQNGEGIDLTPTREIWKWYKWGENKGCFAIEGTKANPTILAEAFRDEANGIAAKEEVDFSCYVGLTKTQDPAPRNWRPTGISQFSWATPNVLSALTDSGINVSISPGGGLGFGLYRDEKGLQSVAKTAEDTRKSGIKALPFFAPACFVKGCKEFNEHLTEWAEGRYKDGQFKPSGGFYLMGCYESAGLVNFMKEGYQFLNKKIPNDGIYCDFIYPLGTCRNPAHLPGVHISMDGLLEFSRWIKKDLIGKDGVFYGHTGYCPVHNVEAYVDLAFIWEEMNYFYCCEGRPVSLQRVQECGVHAANLQRAVDSHPYYSWIGRGSEPLGRIRSNDEDVRGIVTRFALTGLFPIVHTGQCCPVSEQDLLSKFKFPLRLSKAFKGIDLSSFHFMDWSKQDVVKTGNPAVRAAVYFKDGAALVVLGVPENQDKQKFNWVLAAKALRLDGKLAVKNLVSGEGMTVSSDELMTKGLSQELNGFDFAVFSVKNAGK